MRKSVSWIVVGMVLAGCQSTAERGDTASLRPSFDTCIERAEAVTPAMQDCIEAEYIFQETRMEAALAKLQPGIASEQLAWRQHDEAECPWDPDTGGQAQRLTANFCSLKRLARRADDLERKLAR